MDNSTYTVKAIFNTIQGEGFFAGVPAIFIRLTGCNMWSGYEDSRQDAADRTGATCPLWCDTDFTKKGARKLTALEIKNEARSLAPQIKHVVITGGEPFLQIDSDLVRILKSEFFVCVETNGTISCADRFKYVKPDWICCSPKLPENLLKIEYLNELKIVLPDYNPGNYKRLIHLASQHFVQPCDGPDYDKAVTECFDFVQLNPQWRISSQMHKQLGMD